MELRSGRRLVSPPPAPHGGRRRRRRPIGGCSGDAEDRIGGLPEELLLDVLGRLGCARQAARTSVLSRRWRGLWAEVGELRFRRVGADNLEAALARVRPNLDLLDIWVPKEPNLTGARISSMLRAADRLAPAELVVSVTGGRARVAFELPCFASATAIDLTIWRLKFAVAPVGEFASLQQLTLDIGNCPVDLGALIRRCPRLRVLRMSLYIGRGSGTIAVESQSLEEVQLRLWINGPGSVAIVSPELRKLVLESDSYKEFTVSQAAPKLEEFHFKFACSCPCVGLGDKWRLRQLRMETEWSHRNGTPVHEQILSLMILAIANNGDELAERTFAQEIARLPVTHFSVFNLCLRPQGHVFGALVLQLLRIRTSIKRLQLFLFPNMFQMCSENCDCDQDGNWRNEQLSLPGLQDVEIEELTAADHELDFLELVFRSAPMLKRMTIQLSHEVPLEAGKRQRLHSIFEANASVKCSVHGLL